MAWTTPRTWTTSEVVTAAIMNAHVRDNFNALGGAWTAYGSGASWTSTGTAPALGNGTWSGSYINPGKLVAGIFVMTLGSTSTVGTGIYSFALPVTANRSSGACGSAWVFDSSAVTNFGAALLLQTTTTVRIIQGGTAGGSVTATSPVVPANGDVFSGQFVYEAA